MVRATDRTVIGNQLMLRYRLGAGDPFLPVNYPGTQTLGITVNLRSRLLPYYHVHLYRLGK